MIRTVEFRYHIMRNGSYFGELFPSANSAPRISMRSSGTVKTSFSGTFLRPKKDVNWLTDEISPEIIIDGTRYSLGIYCPNKVDESDDGVSKSISVSAQDRCWMVQDHRTEGMYFIAAGTNYVSAAVSVLTASGIAAVSATDTDEVLPEDREWPSGTSYLDIANALLAEINYNQVWFDGLGNAVVEPIAIPDAKNIEHVLDEHSIESLMLPGIRTETDILSAPNVFVCLCSNPDKDTQMLAVAENTNPQSPLSIACRGRRITKVIQVDNIASQEALQTFANRQVTDSMLAGEIITVQTCLLPGFGVNDVIALRYGELMTVCIETGWEMELIIGGMMNHTLERTVIPLG